MHRTPQRASFSHRLLAGDLLLGSANSEVGLEGARRTSICALEPIDGGYRLEKQASTVSYGEYSGAILATARRSPDSPPNEQVLVACVAPDLSSPPPAPGTPGPAWNMQQRRTDPLVRTTPPRGRRLRRDPRADLPARRERAPRFHMDGHRRGGGGIGPCLGASRCPQKPRRQIPMARCRSVRFGSRN